MKTEESTLVEILKRQFHLLWKILFVMFFFAGSSVAHASTDEADCDAQATLEISETDEPGKFIFNIGSDKDFVNLRWVVSSYNTPWYYSSGTRWEYTGQQAEMAYQFPFNGKFRVRFHIDYKVEPDNYCTVIVEKLVDVSGLQPCAVTIVSTIYGKASYEFSYAGAVGTSTSSGNTLLWEFGDGSSSNAQMPRHTYTQEGSYTVKLTRTHNGCTTEAYYTLEAGCKNVKARVTPEKYDGPGMYSFSAEVSEAVKNYTWNFGDGGKWVNRWSPAYKYDYDGTYQVTYTATTVGGCTVTAHETVTITDAHLCGQPKLAIQEYSEPGKFIFIIDSDKPILGTNIGISGIDRQWSYSSGTRWDFNGKHLELYPYKIPYNGPAGVYFNFSYEYAPGKYCYTDLSDTIEVRGYPCTATISAAPQSETFYSFSLTGNNLGKAGTGTTLWEFGDGSTATTFQATHNYQQAGTYIVKATRSYSGCTAVASDTITVCKSGEVPIQIEPASSLGKYTFSVSSGDRITEAYWTIDTDEESIWYGDYYDLDTTTHSITHQFDSNGTYYVWAFVYTENNCYHEGYITFEVHDFGTEDCADVPANITVSKTGQGKYNFVVEPSTNLRNSFAWSFGNGGTSTDLSPAYQYTKNGTYPVTFHGTTTGGCPVVAYDTVIVTDIVRCGKPSLQISGTTDTGKYIYTIDSDIPILGTNFDISGIDRQWAYSSGTRWDYHGTHLDLSYKIPYNGPYRVSFFLQYEYEPGKYCSVSLKDTVSVSGYACTATVDATQTSETSYSFSLSGNNLGKAGTGTTLWEFGDGSTATTFQASHTYQQAGTYVVKASRTYFGCTAVAYTTIGVCKSGEVPVQTGRTASPGGYKFSVASVDPITEAYWGIDSNEKNLWSDSYYDLNTTTHSTTYEFKENGKYSVWAYFFTAHGCYYEASGTLEVNDLNKTNCEALQARINASEIAPGKYAFTAEPADRLRNNSTWNFGDGRTSTVINPQYEYTENGTYELTFSGNTLDGCTVTVRSMLAVTGVARKDIVTDIPASENGDELLIYPNPSTGQLHFSKPVSGTIYDLSGGMVLKLNHQDAATLTRNGIFFLRTDAGQAVKIVIK